MAVASPKKRRASGSVFKVEHRTGATVTHAIDNGNAAKIPINPHPGHRPGRSPYEGVRHDDNLDRSNSDETSQATDPLRDLYADWSEILATTENLTIRLFRSIFDEWHQPTTEPTDVTYAEETVGGVPGIWCLRRVRTPPGPAVHPRRRFRGRLGLQPPQARAHVAKALGVTAFVLDYRRAPEHPHPARPGGRASRRSWPSPTSGIAPENITTIGDSAGGNLAVATALALKEQGRVASRPGDRVLAVARHGEQGRDPGDQRRHGRADHGGCSRA